MRSFNLFSLVMMLATAFFTFNAVAVEANKIHILQNLDPASLSKVMQVLKKRGYVPSTKPIFSESESTVIFTRTDANEVEPASIQFEIVMKKDKSLPKSVFVYKSNSSKVEDVLNAMPNPGQLKEYQIGQR